MKKTQIGRPPKFRHKIAALDVGDNIYFPLSSQDSIKAIASRLGKSYRRRRKYSTRTHGCGVEIERTK